MVFLIPTIANLQHSFHEACRANFPEDRIWVRRICGVLTVIGSMEPAALPGPGAVKGSLGTVP